jgi:hypothetical protein
LEMLESHRQVCTFFKLLWGHPVALIDGPRSVIACVWEF